MSRAYTKAEVREEILRYIKELEKYWGGLPDKTVAERLSGLSFSILTMIDGATMDLPAMDLVLRPHPDDREFNINEGNNYYEDGMVVSDDVHLHDFYHKA